MSTWQSEMPPEEWESINERGKIIMGIPYSHISPEEGQAPRQFNMSKVQEILDKVELSWKGISKEWCSCNYQTDSYSFHIPPNENCPICKATIDNDHYHCGACSKVCQVG